MRLIIILLFVPLVAWGQTDTIREGMRGDTVRTILNEDILKGNAHADSIGDLRTDIELRLLITDTTEMATDADLAAHTGNETNPHSVALNQLENPLDNASFNLANKTVTFTYTNPAGGMFWQWQGAASGHLFELNQNTGNPGPGTHMLHIQTADTDVAALHLAPAGDTAIVTTKNIYAGNYYGTWAGTAPLAYGLVGRLPYMNATGDGFLYSGNLAFDGTRINLNSVGGITFGSGSEYIITRSGTGLYFQTENAYRGYVSASEWRFYTRLIPFDSATIDIGADSLYFNDGYFDDLIVNTPMSDAEVADNITASNYLLLTDTATMLSNYALLNEVGTGDLSASDTAAMLLPYLLKEDTATMLSNYPVTGEYQPAGDYITPSDTADMLSNYQLKGEIGTISDTVVIPYTLPWAFTDSAGMKAGRDYAPFIWAGTTDTIGMDSVCVMSITAGTPNFTFQMYVNDTLNTTATTAVAVFTSAQTVGAASKVKGQWFIPNNRTYILPNEKIWIRFIGRTTVPEYGATLQINGTVY